MATRKGAKPIPTRALDSARLTRDREARAFAEVTALIDRARERALRTVNRELVGLYWEVGRYISDKIAAAEWGDGVVGRLAEHLARVQPGARGFSVQNLWRMRQFYEAYRGDEKLSAVVR